MVPCYWPRVSHDAHPRRLRTCWRIAPDQLRGCSVVVCGENPFSCTSCSFLLELTHDVQRGRCRAHISVCERYIRDTDLRTHHLSNFGPQNPTFAEPTCHPTPCTRGRARVRNEGGKDLARLSCEARAPSLRTRARPRVQGEGIHVDLVYGNRAGWGVGGSVTKRKVYRYTCGSHGRECMTIV